MQSWNLSIRWQIRIVVALVLIAFVLAWQICRTHEFELRYQAQPPKYTLLITRGWPLYIADERGNAVSTHSSNYNILWKSAMIKPGIYRIGAEVPDS